MYHLNQNVNFFKLYSKIHEMVASFTTHMHTDLQQRGIEYNQLFNRYDPMREGLLERMPAMESNRTQRSQWNDTVENIPSPNDLLVTDVTSTETNDSVSAFFITFNKFLKYKIYIILFTFYFRMHCWCY